MSNLSNNNEETITLEQAIVDRNAFQHFVERNTCPMITHDDWHMYGCYRQLYLNVHMKLRRLRMKYAGWFIHQEGQGYSDEPQKTYDRSDHLYVPALIPYYKGQHSTPVLYEEHSFFFHLHKGLNPVQKHLLLSELHILARKAQQWRDETKHYHERIKGKDMRS